MSARDLFELGLLQGAAGLEREALLAVMPGWLLDAHLVALLRELEWPA